jgi:hypothetical protein
MGAQYVSALLIEPAKSSKAQGNLRCFDGPVAASKFIL